MNKPIGIPSGWEEIAAWATFRKGDTAKDITEELAANYIPGFFWDQYHDWRVQE